MTILGSDAESHSPNIGYFNVYEGIKRYIKVYKGIRGYLKVYKGMSRYVKVYIYIHIPPRIPSSPHPPHAPLCLLHLHPSSSFPCIPVIVSILSSSPCNQILGSGNDGLLHRLVHGIALLGNSVGKGIGRPSVRSDVVLHCS